MRHGSLAVAALGCALFAACSQHRQLPAVETLNVSNWADFIAENTIADFERETGIKVNYSTYESDAVIETKLLTGHTDYDVVMPSDTYFERLISAGVFQKLEKAALLNSRFLYPDIMQKLATRDAGNLYGIPYLWTTTGIGYNVDMVKKRLGSDQPDSWSLILDPQNAVKLQDCGIMIVDSPWEVLSTVLIYLGKDPNGKDPTEIRLAADTLMKIRPYVRTIASEGMVDAFTNGSMCAILGWAGDISLARKRAMEASTGLRLRYFLPREGTLIVMDVMGIPADAPHAKNALQFMNYLMRPKVMAEITNAVRYPNAIRASLPFVDETLKSDPASYPDPESRKKLRLLSVLSAEQNRLVTRLWTRFRTGQ